MVCGKIPSYQTTKSAGWPPNTMCVHTPDLTITPFVADVHKDQLIYLEDPQPTIPERASARGRKPTAPVTQAPPARVDKWVSSQPETAWKRMNLRQSTKGRKYVDVMHRRVWLWDHKESEAHCWHLIVRREINARNDIKYSLSNASPDTVPLRLAKMKGQRFWVERSFQDGKSQAGLADYQVRGWKAWHHHVALVMMAMLFMLRERIECLRLSTVGLCRCRVFTCPSPSQTGCGC